MLRKLIQALQDTVSTKARRRNTALSSLRQLRLLQTHKTRLEIRLNHRTKTAYESTISFIDEDQQQLILQVLQAATPEALSPENTLLIKSRQVGQSLHFSTQFLYYQADGQLVVAFPEALSLKQERENFRIYLKPESGLQLFITLHVKLPCTISNLSNSGIAFTVPGDVSQSLNTGDILSGCELQLPGHKTFIIDIALKSISFDKSKPYETAIGARLILNDKEQKKALNQYIWALQRSQRQQEADSLE